jgi:DNA modification methylase
VSVRILIGDCRDTLRELPDGCVQTVVTSPPYFGLRDYGTGEWEGGDPACDHSREMPASVSRASTLAPHRPPMTVTGNQEEAERSRRQYREECGRCGARRVDRQIGLEPSPDEFVQALVGVFREVRRVLRDDGTVWINLGDSYAPRRAAVSTKASEEAARFSVVASAPINPLTRRRYPVSRLRI